MRSNPILFKIQYIILILIFISVSFNLNFFPQSSSQEKWISGQGSATGTDISKISKLALDRARKDALEKNRIEITASTFSLKSEDKDSVSDFFTQFIETNTNGLILDERNVHFNGPTLLDSNSNPIDAVYKVSVSLEVLVGTPIGQPDPNFEVILKTDRDNYEVKEPAELNIRSTKNGYLTILDIHGDSVSVLFPNSLDKNNLLEANKNFRFPPTNAYSLEFDVDNGKESSADNIIAIVTKENIPFPKINKLEFRGSNLLLIEKSLTTYARWLYKIPLNNRTVDIKQIKINKKNN